MPRQRLVWLLGLRIVLLLHPSAPHPSAASAADCAADELPISITQDLQTSAAAGVNGTGGFVCMPYASDGDEMKHNPAINDTLSTYVPTLRS